MSASEDVAELYLTYCVQTRMHEGDPGISPTTNIHVGVSFIHAPGCLCAAQHFLCRAPLCGTEPLS